MAVCVVQWQRVNGGRGTLWRDLSAAAAVIGTNWQKPPRSEILTASRPPICP